MRRRCGSDAIRDIHAYYAAEAAMRGHRLAACWRSSGDALAFRRPHDDWRADFGDGRWAQLLAGLARSRHYCFRHFRPFASFCARHAATFIEELVMPPDAAPLLLAAFLDMLATRRR